MGKIYVVGIGPGEDRQMTIMAREILESCDIIAGYITYIELIKEQYPAKEFYENGMRGEVERCEKCIEFAKKGKTVALICSGDAGIYGMASPLYEVAGREGFEDIEVVPGITAAISGAALLGAPLNHDFCVISLSDLLTPWEVIEKRLRCAAQGDFCIAIYNPASKKRSDYLRRACEILMESLPEATACGYVRNIGRDGGSKKLCTLKDLSQESVDMFVTVFIGNSMTRIIGEKLVTPRGYSL